MSQRMIITCDVTGKDLAYRETVEMTTVNVLFNDVRIKDHAVPDPDNPGKTKIEKKPIVFSQERYTFHICEEHSKDFMKHMQAFFDKKKKELGTE